MNNADINAQIAELEREIAALPAGNISKKKINGKDYYYHRITQNGKRTESYVSFDKPKTVGFHLCRYRIYGKKYENGNVKSFENPIDEAKNENTVKYFDPDKNNEITFFELLFEILKYF